MPKWLNTWNVRLSKWLWWVVIVGIIAALPVLYAREQTESSADKVAIALDYRDLLQVSATQVVPQDFVQAQLANLKEAGVNSMIVFESTLEELGWAGEVNVYNATQAALLEGHVSPPEDNRTYVIFNNPAHEAILRPIIEWAFTHHGADVKSWSADGRSGLSLGMGYDDAYIRPMQPNPIAMKALKDQGFNIIPRLSNRFDPFAPEEVEKWLDSFKALGVSRIVFDGDAVTGFGYGIGDDPETYDEEEGLRKFAQELKQRNIGIAIFENMRVQQKGISKLTNLLGYNALRAHSIGEGEMTALKPLQLEDRLVLAVKDRNIRMLYLNVIASRDSVRGQVYHPLEKLADLLKGDEDTPGVVPSLQDFGYTVGVPQAFDVHTAPQEHVLQGLVVLGAIALVALTIGLFIQSLLAIAFVLGTIGAAGLYVLNSNVMVQALALFVSIAAPTAAVVLLIKRVRELREGAENKPISASTRLGGTLLLFVRTTVLSFAAVPFVVALLNHVTYSLVLQQFRGVSALHLVPIGLVAVYVFLYGSGNTVYGNAKRILEMPLTVVWIVALGALAAGGMYYLTRTGNAGQVSGLEMKFRSLLENAFGVRPRTKEFLLGHPLFFAGIFLALRYRWAMALVIAGTIAQLSMVDTFAHIHTPMMLSLIRVLLGLGLGLIIGLVGIAVWQIGEKIWAAWTKRTA